MHTSWLLSIGLHGGLAAVLLAVAPVAVCMREEAPVTLTAVISEPRPLLRPPSRRELFRPPAPVPEEQPVLPVVTAEPMKLEVADPEAPPAPAERRDEPALTVHSFMAKALPPQPAPAVQAEEVPRVPEPLAGNPVPPYPPAARRAGIEGKVLVRIFISDSGAVERTEIAESSGNELLDESARRTLQRWKFLPARSGRGAVAYAVLVPVVFRLEEKGT